MGGRLGLLALLLAGGCVTVGPELPAKTTVKKGQKTLVLVFAAPSPWITTVEDSKVESAAKFLPGFSQVVETAQSERDLQSSEQLRPYMQHWNAHASFSLYLSSALRKLDYPGEWQAPGPDSETPPETLRRFNTADNVLEWRQRYYVGSPAEARTWRNYAKLLSLDEALILEANVLPQLQSVSDEGVFFPRISVQARIFRGGTLRLLWAREEMVEDTANPRSLHAFMSDPNDLRARYEKALPALAAKLAAALQQSVQAQVLVGPNGTAVSTATAHAPASVPPPPPAPATP